jgi:formamidopyrimidine-DNA glycosylase
MPELPEVETVRLGLSQYIIGASIRAIEVLDERSLKRHLPGPLDFVTALAGAKVLAVVRRGKFLWMPLQLAGKDSIDFALVGHLGMSGQMLIRDVASEPDKLTRVIIYLEGVDGSQFEFRFVDQRIFGSLQIDDLVATPDGGQGGYSDSQLRRSEWSHKIPRSAAHISRDPLDQEFDLGSVIKRMRGKNSGIKRVLLDQGVVSGIGNIYADEALWAAQLHYDRPARDISRSKLELLMGEVQGLSLIHI